jgi:hypothetical protein
VLVTETPHRRRRRIRPEADLAVPTPADLAAMAIAGHDPASPDPEPEPALEDREAERGLRGLVGGGSSQVGVTAAMRARDATRPSDAELADAEANLMIIRRGWTPPQR